MDRKVANAIPLTDILAKLGCQPQRKDDREWWYASPFRQESTPSFRVNTATNRWKDWGRGDLRERSVIDFMIVLHHLGETDVHGACSELEHLMGPGYAVNPLKHRERDPAACAAPKPRPQRGIAIERVQPLRHEALLKYLTGTRCLDDPRILHAYLEEVYFINHGVPSPRLFYAIGFQNDAGGYELRNARFKGSAAPKRIRTVPGADARTVALFEGWTDFLSFLHHHRTVTPPTDCLVLNSTKLLQHAIDAIRQREEPCTAIVCYPHHDEEGQAVVAAMREAFPCIPVTDRGGSYAPHNDYNAWWQACSHAGRMESA